MLDREFKDKLNAAMQALKEAIKYAESHEALPVSWENALAMLEKHIEENYTHPTVEELAAYATRNLRGELLEDVQKHLDSCEICGGRRLKATRFLLNLTIGEDE